MVVKEVKQLRPHQSVFKSLFSGGSSTDKVVLLATHVFWPFFHFTENYSKRRQHFLYFWFKLLFRLSTHMRFQIDAVFTVYSRNSCVLKSPLWNFFGTVPILIMRVFFNYRCNVEKTFIYNVQIAKANLVATTSFPGPFLVNWEGRQWGYRTQSPWALWQAVGYQERLGKAKKFNFLIGCP